MTEATTLEKAPFVGKTAGMMRQHVFGYFNRCEFCGVTREQVEDNVVHSTCFVADRKEALASGEYATRVGTVYMRSKAHLSQTMRENVMQAVAMVLRANTDAARGLAFRVVDGNTLIIEMADVAAEAPAPEPA